ncbi:WD repeat protein [Aspergillus aculeatinus CBS 121060]|uniref:WD40 repeat-like protein n=1 Tax=Aspergillus aculeatinus CBS 121060 TaxID=1448322 RepID=A0ACD1HDD2_9EURO|nr:WD40 repeat-like protein [Aspergillus aculeatinus CBS 121060]RAH71425.1 WD40 repeat-like protein [Aspergillus aculeatinus CBS 121060]
MSHWFALQESDDDESVVEEAENLLAQFLGPSNPVKREATQSVDRTETPTIQDRSPATGSTRSLTLPRTPESLRPRSQDKLPITDHSQVSDSTKAARARRSGRSRKGPANYYDCSNYEGFGSNSEVSQDHEEAVVTSSRPRKGPAKNYDGSNDEGSGLNREVSRGREETVVRSSRPRKGPANYYDRSNYEGFGSHGGVGQGREEAELQSSQLRKGPARCYDRSDSEGFGLDGGASRGRGDNMLMSSRPRRYRSDSLVPNPPRRRRGRSYASSPCSSVQHKPERPHLDSCLATPPLHDTHSGPARDPSNTLTALLQQRQLGRSTARKIRTQASDNFEKSWTWKGASGDVIVLGWSPDGTKFAAGAAAQCDEHNMAYNQNNNLLFGDLTTNTLQELPDHWVPRPRTRAANNLNLHDSRLFMSVTAIEWWDDALFTASYDNTVRLWHSSSKGTGCFERLWHDTRVEVMARSKYVPNLLATGTREIGLWRLDERTYTFLETRKSRSNKAIEMVPSSLAWGTIQETGNILLAGLCEKGHDSLTPDGQLLAWQVSEASITPLNLLPGSQNVFDIKWHPSLPVAAVANYIAHSPYKAFKESRSSVRIYEPLSSKVSVMEFECPALDINDVTFCPTNTNYLTASCTDGATYVWDYRNPAEILHKLQHGEVLNPIDQNQSREQVDVGVRTALWGNTVCEFYSGATDGVVKKWNILRAPEDVLEKDLASLDEEIMSLSFSPDKTNLLVGDAAGGIHMLSSGPFSRTEDNAIEYKPACEPPRTESPDKPDSGVAAGAELLRSGQLERHPIYGVGKGPYYDGPFAAWARPENTPADELAYTRLADKWQALQLDGLDPRYRFALGEKDQQQVELQRKIAQARNQRAGYKKRIHMDAKGIIDLCSDEESEISEPPFRPKRRLAESHMNVAGVDVIDLTSDPVQAPVPEPPISTAPAVSSTPVRSGLSSPVDEDLCEALEEDFWWPPNETVDPNFKDD